MSEPKQRLTSASKSKLPVVSEIPDTDTMQHAVRLMREASGLRAKVSEAEDRLDEIRGELAAICEGYGMAGFKHGLNGFEYHGYQTRRTLSKEKLVQVVAADVIDSCYEESKPFLSSKFVSFDLE